MEDDIIQIEVDGKTIGALAEGWTVADQVSVFPKDAEPLATIRIRARYINQASWLPAYSVLQIKVDGAVVWEWSAFLGPGEEYTQDIDYKLPSSISSGTHIVQALEQEQATAIPRAEFTVTPPAPPGQRNLSVSSIPAGANIYIGGALYGNSPVTVTLPYGTYEVTAVYGGVEQTRNVQVMEGSGTQSVEFVFEQGGGFDIMKFLDDNKWYIIGGAGALGLLYLAVKKPATLKRGYEKTKEYAGKGYQKAKDVYKGVAEA